MEKCYLCNSSMSRNQWRMDTADGRKYICIDCRKERDAHKKREKEKLRGGFSGGMAFSKLKKKIIAERGAQCQRCHGTDSIELHHIKHVANGGSDDPGNLQLLCHNCHRFIAH